MKRNPSVLCLSNDLEFPSDRTRTPEGLHAHAVDPTPAELQADHKAVIAWERYMRVASRYRQVMPWIVDRRHYVPNRRRCSSTIAPS
jgi:hypothetical protein